MKLLKVSFGRGVYAGEFFYYRFFKTVSLTTLKL